MDFFFLVDSQPWGEFFCAGRTKELSMPSIAGKYEVLSLLGEGGTGKVFLVEHNDLGVRYALKLLSRSLTDSPHFIERFKAEASVLQTFTHPGVTQLRDFGRLEDGSYYLAMDYCQGASLKDILESDGPYPLRRSLEIMIQILDVLAAAHESGIIHRDIKPANVVVETQSDGKEYVRVLDFGTALVKEGFDPNQKEQNLFGTPCYMAPEQASGAEELDHRADLYSAGILMYELLTGEVPFDGANVVQTLLMHLTQPVPNFAELYGMPLGIQEIVHRALAKKPQERFASAREFQSACREMLKKVEEGLRMFSEPQAPEERSSRSEPATKDPSAPNGKKTTILCLDDDEMILYILKHILEVEGYTVYTAKDCSAIHDILFKKGVDLLISDVQMPGMPGTKICQLIKKSFEDIRVVLFSNIPERDLEKASEQNGADGWISKNSKPDVWLRSVRRFLD